MRIWRLAALSLAAVLTASMLTGCPWDKEADETDDASSVPAASSSTSQPDYDGTSDDENTGNPSGEDDNPGEGGEGDEGETGQPQDSYDESTNTYTVASEDGLRTFAAMVNDGQTDVNCILECDITLSGDWTPIGNSYGTAYTGAFDGQGHTISGLTINTPDETCVGMFGYVGETGKVQNLNLENVNISGSNNVGGVAGWNKGAITGCMVSGSVSGSNSVGGVAGQNAGMITGCCFVGDNVICTVAVSDVGGVVGTNVGEITGCCFAGGRVSGGANANVGGVVGYNFSNVVTNCYWKKGPNTAVGNDNGADGCTPIGDGGVSLSTAIEKMNTYLTGYHYVLEGDKPVLKPISANTMLAEHFGLRWPF